MSESPLDVLGERLSRAVRLVSARQRRGDGAVDRRVLLRTTSELQAVATVLVMLDLVSEGQAEQVLIEHRRLLEVAGVELSGVASGELTLCPSVAYGFDQARRRPLASLRYRPVAVAAPQARVRV